MFKWLFSLSLTIIIIFSLFFYFFSSYRDIANIYEKAEKDYNLNVERITTKEKEKIESELAKEEKKDIEEKEEEENSLLDEFLNIDYKKVIFSLFFLVAIGVAVYFF